MIQLTRSHLYTLLILLPIGTAIGMGLVWLIGGAVGLFHIGIAAGSAIAPAHLIVTHWNELQTDWTPYERAMDGQISWTEALERGEGSEVEEEPPTDRMCRECRKKLLECLGDVHDALKCEYKKRNHDVKWNRKQAREHEEEGRPEKAQKKWRDMERVERSRDALRYVTRLVGEKIEEKTDDA